ncbi:MAG: PAS domain S-box protein [Methylococcaceae bacterium]|nr:PAS domain S-box protein [Methylococcaceae bacterium]
MKTTDKHAQLRPLKRRLLISLLTAFFLLSALTVVLHRVIQDQAIETDSKTALDKNLELLSSILAYPLTSNNPAEMQALLNAFAKSDEKLFRVKAIDKNASVFLDWQNPAPFPSDALIGFQTQIVYNNESIGHLETVWIKQSSKPLKTLLSSYTLLLSIGSLALLAMAAFYVVLKFFINPFENILLFANVYLLGSGIQRPIQNLKSIEFKKMVDILLLLGTSYKEHKEVKKTLEETQHEIQKINGRFNLILNSAGSGVYILDKAGKIVFVNAAAIEILGWSSQECVGRCLNELIQTRASDTGKDKTGLEGCKICFLNQDLINNEPYYLTFMDGKKHEVEGEIFWNKIGQPIAVKYVSTPILENEAITGAIIIFENINLRLEAEQKLKDSEALKQAMLESSLAAIITIDEQGKIYEFNKNAEDMFGFKKSDVLLKEMAELIIPERYRDAHWKGMAKYLKTGEHNIIGKRIEITALKESGEEFPVELVISPIKLQSKLLFTSFINDITEKNRAKNAIENARIAAENANKAKSQFLAAMSHEIRTPLNAIIGVNELMQTTELDLEQQEYVKIAHQAGVSLQEVVNNILDYSKVEAGKMEFHLQKTDILAVVDSVLSIMGPRASEKKLDLFTTVDYPIPEKTLIDPARLRQILLNLVSNAIKFTQKGSVEIRVGMKSNTLGSSSLQFSVTDTGIGVSEDAKKLIFEEFTQADLSTTRKYGGTGLGLAIASRLVSIFGGEIGAESVEGKGSTFWFTVIPANKELSSPTLYKDLNCYVFNSVQKSTYAFYKTLNAQCANVKFISSTHEIPHEPGLSIVFIDERQLPFYSTTEVEALNVLNRIDLVKVLITEIGPKYKESRSLKDFDTYLVRPLQIRQLHTFIKNCLDYYNKGQKIRRRTAKSDRVKTLSGKGHHLLLVEDSINNQKVIKAMLEKADYEIDIADNGHEALQKAKLNVYDMILMDLSMPVMGGMETTEHLRKNEGPNQKTPIIALTASAYDDKREDCIQIGMNGILSKPLNMASLQQEIARLLKQKTVKLSHPENDTAPLLSLAANNRIIDYSILEQLKADTSEHIFPELIAIFLEQSKSRVTKIEQAVNENDFSVLASEVHSLKSESATYGAVKLGELTAEINLLCHQNETDSAFEAAKQIRESWQSAYNELKKYHLTLSNTSTP